MNEFTIIISESMMNNNGDTSDEDELDEVSEEEAESLGLIEGAEDISFK